jgi:hypothetical protein
VRRKLVPLKAEGADPKLGKEIDGAEWIEDGATVSAT